MASNRDGATLLMVRFARAVTALVIVGAFVAALAAQIPVWPLELFDHFRVHYLAIGLLATAAAFALQLRGYFDAGALATLMNVCVLLPDAPRASVPAEGTPLRVLLLNVHTSSSDFGAVRRLIDDTHPDLIGLVEVDQRWLDALAPSLTAYMGRIEHPRDDNFGVALYARGTVTGDAEKVGSNVPTIVAKVSVEQTSLTVVVTHPVPPMNSHSSSVLEAQLDAVARRTRNESNVLVMGDFNSTPWSRPFRRLLAGSNLCDSRDGFGLQASFPASPWLLRIPIDHLLHSCSIGVTARRIERDVGSDHLPVLVDLVIPTRTSARPRTTAP